MSILALHYEAAKDCRAMDDIEDARWMAKDRLGKKVSHLIREQFCDEDWTATVHDLASDAIFEASMYYGVEYADIGTEADVIAAADIVVTA